MTVNSKKRGRPAANTRQLSAASIVDCAKQWMQQHGNAPSIRALAAELGVDAMAIYHYFHNKAALMRRITLSLIDELYQPHAKQPWQEELHRLCNSYLALMSRYPGLLETWLSSNNLEPAQQFSQRLGQALESLNIEDGQLEAVEHLLVDYMNGHLLAIQCNQTDTVLKPEMPQPVFALMVRLLQQS